MSKEFAAAEDEPELRAYTSQASYKVKFVVESVDQESSNTEEASEDGSSYDSEIETEDSAPARQTTDDDRKKANRKDEIETGPVRRSGNLDEDYEDTDKDSVDSITDRLSYLKAEPVEVVNFFDTIGTVHNLSSISLDTADGFFDEEGEEEEKHDTKIKVRGSVEESETTPELTTEEEEDEEDEDEKQSNLLSEIRISEDNDLLDELQSSEPEVVVVPVDKQAEEIFETFLEQQEQVKVLFEDEEELKAKAIAEERWKLTETILSFVDEIIERVVTVFEYVDPVRELQSKLDKVKLLEEIQKKWKLLEDLKSDNWYLNRAATTYYRRKRRLNYLVDDSNVSKKRIKYMNALDRLDKLMGRETAIRTTYKVTIKNLKDAAQVAEKTSKEKIEHFENLVRSTFKMCNLEKFVENGIAEISLFRDEISSVRLVVINYLATLAVLQTRLYELEDLGNGLTIQNYENLQTKTYMVGEKIEDRNIDLNKLHRRTHIDIHVLSHMHEKASMLRNTVDIQKSSLQELIETKTTLRIFQFQLTAERARLRKEIADAIYNSGLVSDRLLMFDYDETAERAERLKKRNIGLALKIKELTTKIADVEYRNSALSN